MKRNEIKKRKIMLTVLLNVTAIFIAITFVIPTITPFGVIASIVTVIAAYVQLFKLLKAEHKADKER